MIVLDLDDRLRKELLETLALGLRQRMMMGHPPSEDLGAAVRQLLERGQERPGAVPSGHVVETPGIAAHDRDAVISAMSYSDACRMTGLGERTIRRAVAGGELHAVRIGRRVLFRPEDIVKWLDERGE